MQRLPEIRARLQSLADLDGVVRALRAISAARVQQAHAVLDSIRRYTTIVQGALADAAENLSPSGDPTGASDDRGYVVVFGSERGFVGAFNDHLLEASAAQVRPRDVLLVVGARALLAASERQETVSWSCAMASQVGGIDDVALRVAEGLARAGGTLSAARMTLVYTRNASGTSQVVSETLVPFDTRPLERGQRSRPSAMSNVAPGPLLDGLVTELLFAKLAHAAAESFASENAARLVAMESASDNIAGKLEELRRTESEVRQEDITTELLEIVTGAEAVARRV